MRLASGRWPRSPWREPLPTPLRQRASGYFMFVSWKGTGIDPDPWLDGHWELHEFGDAGAAFWERVKLLRAVAPKLREIENAAKVTGLIGKPVAIDY